MIRNHHYHKLQTNPWHREEEPPNIHETPGRQTKPSNQLSLPHQDDCKTRIDIIVTHNKTERLQNPTMGVTINNESTTAEPSPSNGQQPKPLGSLNTSYWYQILGKASRTLAESLGASRFNNRSRSLAW